MKRRVVVTGVTRGLGRVMAERLISLGHHVVGCGRGARHVEELTERHPSHDFATVDVADARHRMTYAGRTYYFCSPGCLASFQADPDRYAVSATKTGQ